MIRLFPLFLLCVTSVIASDQIPEVSTFSRVASQEIWEGKPSQAMCLVIGDLLGSGALVSVDGHVCVLTAAHLGTPKSVHFMVPYKTAANLQFDSMQFVVKSFFSMQKELHSSVAQNDLQILLVDGNPERWVTPLMLTSEIDTAQPISGYGFGNLVAEFSPGRLSVGVPAQYKLDESGEAIRMSLLPSKVVFRKYEVNPIASWFEDLKLRRYSKINPTTSKRDGVILATTTYDPTKLETHAGGGFSGGPILQNDNIVGIFQGGSLAVEEIITPSTQKRGAFQILGMWGLYLAGHKIPFLQKVAPFAYDPIISPSIRYVLGWLGYNHLSTPVRLCMFNTAVFAAVNIYLVGNKMYARSLYALKRSHEALFVHMTPEIIRWIKSKLAGGATELNTAS